MNIVTVTHRTAYRYASPVGLGEHRLMLRPRSSPDLTVIDARLYVSPNARLARRHDALGNIIDTASFEGRWQELLVVSRFTARHTPRGVAEIKAAARMFGCTPLLPDEAGQIMLASQRTCADPSGAVAAWAGHAAATAQAGDHFDLMRAMAVLIHEDFTYTRRESEGTQAPEETLRLGTGSCRDFAYLLIEAARSLGFPARFVSGYLYEPLESGESGALTGGGSTHAWAEIHIPVAGWVDFDPTNNLAGGHSLLKTASVLKPSDALPLRGTFTGFRSDYLGMDVEVSATSEHPSRWQPQALRDPSRPENPACHAPGM